MSKPRIYRFGGNWHCVSLERHGQVRGFGDTPAEAFNDWVEEDEWARITASYAPGVRQILKGLCGR